MIVKKALLTGATGFIGSHLATYLVADGWDVHIIIRPNSNYSLLRDIINNITIYIHDGSSSDMLNIFSKAQPATVFHLASLFLDQHQPEDIEPMIKSNILFGVQLLEAMKLHHVCRLINTGTSWQHYNNADYDPVCLYAATKQAFEDILKYYIETTSIHAITLKLFDTFGPNDLRNKLFQLFKIMQDNTAAISFSEGEQLIDLVYIDDVVDAFYKAAVLLQNNSIIYDCFSISSGHPLSLKDLVKIYCNLSGKQLPIDWGSKPYRPREVMIPWNMGKPLPNWHPKYSLESGIKKLLTF